MNHLIDLYQFIRDPITKDKWYAVTGWSMADFDGSINGSAPFGLHPIVNKIEKVFIQETINLPPIKMSKTKMSLIYVAVHVAAILVFLIGISFLASIGFTTFLKVRKVRKMRKEICFGNLYILK